MHSIFRATVSLALALIPFRIAAQDASSIPGPPSLALQPGDVAPMAIWREEDLSGEFPMDESEVVVLPLLGERRVVGIPFKELRNALLTDYRAELRHPLIVITPLRRVFVLGEVNSPGLQSVDLTISLAGAIALAGGASNEGDLSRIAVVRDRQAVFYTVPFRRRAPSPPSIFARAIRSSWAAGAGLTRTAPSW